MNLLNLQNQRDELNKIKSEADNSLSKLNLIEKELESYGKRLWALQEKGFIVKVLT